MNWSLRKETIISICEVASKKGTISKDDDFLYENRVDIKDFMALNECEIELENGHEPKKELGTFATLIYNQCMILNNLGVIFHSTGRSDRAKEVLDKAATLRSYNNALPQEKGRFPSPSPDAYSVS